MMSLALDNTNYLTWETDPRREGYIGECHLDDLHLLRYVALEVTKTFCILKCTLTRLTASTPRCDKLSTSSSSIKATTTKRADMKGSTGKIVTLLLAPMPQHLLRNWASSLEGSIDIQNRDNVVLIIRW
ncbi:unnamed protein product [Callosobruchus maculatus]|uniref:Uncharacterized protein n=1 Tax=Callosobruchus maculatus TaxID=64391 RepID=A0A653C7X8_CALMS|nr:unnamed protein product [Callosobruchus maculatus]